MYLHCIVAGCEYIVEYNVLGLDSPTKTTN